MVEVIWVVGIVVPLLVLLMLASRVRKLTNDADRLRVERSQSEARAAEADRKREAQFDCIARIEAERNEWRQMYEQHALEHGNAQALLFNECTRLAAICRRHGVNVELTQAVREAVLEFHEVRVEPQLKPDSKVIKPQQEQA